MFYSEQPHVSLERLAKLILSIPEGVVERRTAVHPVHAFTSIGHDCVGCFVGTWKGDCLGSSSRGQPLHQVTQRQVIKFADPTRRSGHTTCYTRCIDVCASRCQVPILELGNGPGDSRCTRQQSRIIWWFAHTKPCARVTVCA